MHCSHRCFCAAAVKLDGVASGFGGKSEGNPAAEDNKSMKARTTIELTVSEDYLSYLILSK